MSEKIEGTILIADGIEGRTNPAGRYAGISFGKGGVDCVQVGWDGQIVYATTADRFWFAGFGTVVREGVSS